MAQPSLRYRVVMYAGAWLFLAACFGVAGFAFWHMDRYPDAITIAARQRNAQIASARAAGYISLHDPANGEDYQCSPAHGYGTTGLELCEQTGQAGLDDPNQVPVPERDPAISP